MAVHYTFPAVGSLLAERHIAFAVVDIAGTPEEVRNLVVEDIALEAHIVLVVDRRSLRLRLEDRLGRHRNALEVGSLVVALPMRLSVLWRTPMRGVCLETYVFGHGVDSAMGVFVMSLCALLVIIKLCMDAAKTYRK